MHLSACKRRFLWVFGLALLSVGIFVMVVRLRGHAALEAYKRGLVAGGEKLSFEELLPPAPPPGQDGSKDFFLAFDRFDRHPDGFFPTNSPSAMRLTATGRALTAWRESAIRTSAETNSWEALRAELNSRADGFASLQGLLERPLLAGQRDYAHVPRVAGRSLAPGITRHVHLLNMSALAHLHERNTRSSVTNVLLGLAIIRGSEHEPDLISQIVRCSSAQNVLHTQWELSQAPDLSEEELHSLQSAWEAAEFSRALERCLAVEQLLALAMADEMKRSAIAFSQYAQWSSQPWFAPATTPDAENWYSSAWRHTKASVEKSRQQVQRLTWRTMWVEYDQLNVLKAYHATRMAIRRGRETDGYRPFLTTLKEELSTLGFCDAEEERETPGPTRILTLMNATTLNRLPEQMLQAEIAREIAVAALALKRFQLAHRRWPVSLGELLPQFAKRLPLDLVDGRPLRYEPMADGQFRLYSIGLDGTDDGGQIALKPGEIKSHWKFRRDLVWPMPATEAEKAAYYLERASQSQ